MQACLVDLRFLFCTHHLVSAMATIQNTLKDLLSESVMSQRIIYMLFRLHKNALFLAIRQLAMRKSFTSMVDWYIIVDERTRKKPAVICEHGMCILGGYCQSRMEVFM